MINLQILRSDFEQKVAEYFPECFLPLKAALAVLAINSFQSNRQPVTLIFSGPSGSGKTLVLSMLSVADGEKEQPADYLFRCDNFTPRAFVTHAASISREELEKIDLLPKIEGKTLITKELAPLFRGKKEDLTQTFSMLTSILDGMGYISSTGSQGSRGYNKLINFTWLGATTPLSNDTFRIMAQLGPRIMFFNTARKEKTVAELVRFAKQRKHFKIVEECTRSVSSFLGEFYKKHPLKSFDESTINFDDSLLTELCILARLIARLRSGFTVRDTKDESAEDGCGYLCKENEERAIIMLMNIALGSALMEQRDYVNDLDLYLIKHIALSSCPEGRRLILKALVGLNGTATARDLMAQTEYSKPTCLKYMRELSHLGVCTYQDDGHEDAHSIKMADDFSALLGQAPDSTENDETQKAVVL